MEKRQKVYLGLSGGVDSALAAVLLLEKGFDVHAVFLKIWSDSSEDQYCPWVDERRDAIKVAAHLGISITTVDFEKEYKEEVFRYFVSEYEKGRTPNPDILCNQMIKFGSFLQWAKAQGADYIATGHHVRRLPETGNIKDVQYHLLSGKDAKKDQSYFLATITQDQLRQTLFPIGNYTKEEVRTLAKEKGLDFIADKPSTKGICFIGDVELKKFLANYTKKSQGIVVDLNGEEIGSHQGVSFYTIGQRKGLQIKVRERETHPYFVVAKNQRNNTLIVSDDEKDLLQKTIFLSQIHTVSGKDPDPDRELLVKIRSTQVKQQAKLVKEGDQYHLEFVQPQKGVAPGQVAVFYDGEELLGSAIIEEYENS